MNAKAARERLYLGVDIGGTKLQASLVAESGTILGKQRQTTPRTGGPEQVLAGVEAVMKTVLDEAKLETTDLTAIGVAVPGVVDPKTGNVVVTPNMSLTGVAIGGHLESCFRVPVAIGNDGNLGAYGESWLGSARKAKSALGIWVGTGIGAGFVQKGKVWRGARESACEIGHIVMQIGGPVCGCGNHGCLEALASRTAIERDIRAALAAGGTSKLTELSGGDLSVIRSGAIRKALKAEDPLVTGILHRAAETLGYACLTVRHLIDPEVIVLGGGLIEACSEYMMPILENIVGSDRLPARGTAATCCSRPWATTPLCWGLWPSLGGRSAAVHSRRNTASSLRTRRSQGSVSVRSWSARRRLTATFTFRSRARLSRAARTLPSATATPRRRSASRNLKMSAKGVRKCFSSAVRRPTKSA